MLHDPSFWVAAAFFIFLALTLKPCVRKIKFSLEDYRAQLLSELEEAKQLKEKAALALEKAQLQAMERAETEKEILKNTDHHLKHAQRHFEEARAHLRKDAEKETAYHREVVALRIQKEVRALVLSRLVEQTSQLCMKEPLGMPEGFFQAVQTLPLPVSPSA